jgi:hypothetical protein
VACLCADADDFSSSKGKNFCLASFLAKKKKTLKVSFFSHKKARQQKVFALG